MRQSLEDFAFENGLKITESTSELSGYPKNLRSIIYGFESFSEARSIAEKNNLDIIYLKRRFGQDLWSRCGNVYEPFNTCDFLDEEKEGWIGKTTYSSRQQFYQQFVRPELEDAGEDIIEDATSLRIFAENCEAIQNELEDMNDDEILVYRTDLLFDEDFTFETRPETSLRIEEDSTEYLIGLIDNE